MDLQFFLIKFHFVSIVKNLGKGALIGKKDIQSAFKLLPIYPGDFDLLGFKIGSNYYIDKCLPMGCSISCSTFEHFSTFIHTKSRVGQMCYQSPT
jgi:hypothetical protein